MRIAVIGSGISGLTAAWALTRQGHEVTVFEASHRLGGHTATIDVDDGGKQLAVDTGFIVFNDWTYPNFIRLMESLEVETLPTDMSFSVSDGRTGLEYAGSSLDTLFAQRRNLLSPRFLGMLRDILRFNRSAERHLQSHPETRDMSLGDYLDCFGYGEAFREQYLIPMGAAIWSARQENMLRTPLQFFVRFFRNHGLLNITNRPQWRVIAGGSREYISPLVRSFRQRIRLSTPVLGIRRPSVANASMEVRTRHGSEVFDQVVFSCHSDQALAILGEAATALERELLTGIPYERNEVVLHRDTRLLPTSRRCWSSWNVALDDFPDARPRLTYNMNILQRLQSQQTWCVSLNQTDRIREEEIVGVYHYDHPIFDKAGMDTQRRWAEISGVNGVWYCGAWWRNGFHEDGVWSALRVADAIAEQENNVGSAEHAA